MSYPRQSILFISGLDKAANETLLYQLFNEFPISYIKIAKDHNTRESYGYAFVGFKNHAKAEEALIKLNYSKILKKSIQISWYNREPNNFRARPEFNVFVKKLSKDVKPKEFHDFFSKFGNIVSAKLAEDDEGDNIGYGFVLYDNEEASKNAIKQGNGLEWKGKKLFVGQFIKNKPKKIPQFNTVYCKNLDKVDDIKKLFSPFGEILSVFVKPTDPAQIEALPEDKKKSILEHQFAFITFRDPKSAARVVNEIPYTRLNDRKYNDELKSLIEGLRGYNIIEERHLYRFACFITENEKEYTQIAKDKSKVTELSERFRKHLSENDDNYLPVDKTDRLECCQALKKRERIKRLKILYERIKRQIKDKYMLCNLYVKNLPDNFDETQIRELFSKYGLVRSCKTVRKELVQSYLGIKRSVKVFGYVCFFEKEHAHEAIANLNNTQVFPNGPKLYVDYHKSKQDRAEFLKLKMLNYQKKQGANPGEMQFPPNLGKGMFPMFNPQMLRKFPPQSPFNNLSGLGNMRVPFMNNGFIPPIREQIDFSQMDKSTRRDFFGEKLFTKISSNPAYASANSFFSKIIGIFLDLDDKTIIRLIDDDNFFSSQVNETVKQLRERGF